jgi:hypothetical protein
MSATSHYPFADTTTDVTYALQGSTDGATWHAIHAFFILWEAGLAMGVQEMADHRSRTVRTLRVVKITTTTTQVR